MSTSQLFEGQVLRDCIQCGFCLEACTTYRQTFEEGLSPRGRIMLLRTLTGQAGEDGDHDQAIEAWRLLDLCLFCRACEVACPSGVRYGSLITEVRDRLPRPPGESPPRLLRFSLRSIFPRPRLLALTLRAVRCVGCSPLARLIVRVLFPKAHRPHFLHLLSSVRRASGKDRSAEGSVLEKQRKWLRAQEERSDAAGAESMVPLLDVGDPVLIFRGCVTPVIFPGVLSAWYSLLDKMGVVYSTPKGQTCCGALHQQYGELKQARALARRNIAAFEATGSGFILVESAGCGAALKGYGDLLADDPLYAESARRFSARVRDVSEILAERGGASPAEQGNDEGAAPADQGNDEGPAPAEQGNDEGPAPADQGNDEGPAPTGQGNDEGPAPADQSVDLPRVVYQEPCQLRHVQQVAECPRTILDHLPGLERVPTPEADLCCGAAGIYALLQPAMAASLGDRKAEQLVSTGAELVVTTDPGCRIQLDGRLASRGVEMRHLLEVCDALWPAKGSRKNGKLFLRE
ncbi:MAG: 4Fe-4S dicluster domain-containing protein, partial [Candidatus Eisenbacteria sp.]|nr:4Fe-4S dicluster domain-containing protein [Candidatus Eisenbacteria bacterium]